MSVNFSENIPTATEIMKQKFSIYLLRTSNHMFKFIFKISHIHLLLLFVDMYILKVFFKKKHDFARLIFSVNKFQEMRTKSLFLSFQNSFSASHFLISQEPLGQNSSLTPLWNNN